MGKLHDAYHTNQKTKNLSNFRFHKAANRYPASMRHCANADLMFGHRLRRCPTLSQHWYNVSCLLGTGLRGFMRTAISIGGIWSNHSLHQCLNTDAISDYVRSNPICAATHQLRTQGNLLNDSCVMLVCH